MEKDGTARQATDDNTLRLMRPACWILKAPDAHSEHVIIIDFPLQQWLQESAPTLRYTYSTCLVKF